MGSLKVFISYNHKDYDLASNLHKELEFFGIEIFLAHKTIEPSKEWQEEIEKNLKECDVFMPLLTDNFRDSRWTDQEVGIAYAYGKKFIPLIYHIVPYGFMGKWQGHRIEFTGFKRIEGIPMIIDLLVKFFPEKLRQSAIDSISFKNIHNYEKSNRMFSLLKKLEPFSNDQVIALMQKSVDNDQIIDGTEANPLLKQLLEDYKEKLDPSLMIKIKKRLEQGYRKVALSEEIEKEGHLSKGLEDGLL
ncbi:MAG: toll/interleukin-1 receptor domain-containing protein [Nanoarchaeota archaeon]